MIGVDPGSSGAVALVKRYPRLNLLWWGAWRPVRGGFEAIESVKCSGSMWSNATDATDCLIRDAQAHGPLETTAVVELIKPHGARKGFVSLAESAGRCVAICEMRDLSVIRIPPQEWRARVLGVRPGTDKARCDQASYEFWGFRRPSTTRRPRVWPSGPGYYGGPIPPSWAHEHVAAAACMAVAGVIS